MPTRKSIGTDTAPKNKKTAGYRYLKPDEGTPQPEARATAPSARELRARKREEQVWNALTDNSPTDNSPTDNSPTINSPSINSPTVITIDSSDDDEPSEIPPTSPPSGQQENPILIPSDPEESDETDEEEATQLDHPVHTVVETPPRRPNIHEWFLGQASSGNPVISNRTGGRVPISRLPGNFGRANNKGQYSNYTKGARRPLPELRAAPAHQSSRGYLLPVEPHRSNNEDQSTNTSTVRRTLAPLLPQTDPRSQLSDEDLLPSHIRRPDTSPPQIQLSSTTTNDLFVPSRSWLESEQRFWFLDNNDTAQRMTYDGYRQWTCWSCRRGIPGMPDIKNRADMKEWIMSKSYIKFMDLFSQYGDHLCGDQDCIDHRKNLMLGVSTQIHCSNDKGCLAIFTMVNDDSDTPDRGFKVIEQGNPTITHHCCSEHCRTSVSLELNDKERQAEKERQSRNFTMSRDIDDRFDNYPGAGYFANPYGHTASSVAASSTGSAGMSGLAIDPHAGPSRTGAGSPLENDRSTQAYGGGSSYTSNWNAINR